MLGFFTKESLSGVTCNFLFFFLFLFLSFNVLYPPFSATPSDGSSLELLLKFDKQEPNSESWSVIPFSSLSADFALIRLLEPRISPAIEVLGGVLLCSDRLCLLTNTSSLGWLTRNLWSKLSKACTAATKAGDFTGAGGRTVGLAETPGRAAMGSESLASCWALGGALQVDEFCF